MLCFKPCVQLFIRLHLQAGYLVAPFTILISMHGAQPTARGRCALHFLRAVVLAVCCVPGGSGAAATGGMADVGVLNRSEKTNEVMQRVYTTCALHEACRGPCDGSWQTHKDTVQATGCWHRQDSAVTAVAAAVPMADVWAGVLRRLSCACASDDAMWR